MLFRVCIAILMACLSGLATAAEPTVGAFQLVSTRQVSPFEYLYTYKATVSNPGGPLVNVTAAARSVNASIVVVDPNLSFGDVGAVSNVVSQDTFAIRKSQSQSFRTEDLVWTVSGTPASSAWAGFTATPTTGAAPLAVRFTPLPLTDAAINLYRWDFDGNGSTDVSDTIGRNQSYTYASPGTYPSALTITDSLGRVDKRVVNIVVTNAPPVVTTSASPTNGSAPLLVSFSASATDNEGVARFEWDFDGDGTYDRVINGTSGSTSYTYAVAGTFAARLRVTDNLGGSVIVTDPLLTIRVAAAGAPRATLSASPTTGIAPLAVRLTTTYTDPLGQAVQLYEWDVDGNGSFETSGTANFLDAVYPGGGSFYPRSRITMTDGRKAEDVKKVKVTANFQLSVTSDTLDTQLGQTSQIVTTLPGPTRVSLVVEPRGKPAIRTLVPTTLRAAGRFVDTWDGRADNGQPVPEGIYHVVMLYEQDGKTQRFDLSTSTGGAEYNPPRTTIPPTFEPFNYKPMVVDFTLTRASEVTAFVGSFDVDTRYVTFYTRQALGRGTHRILWNGDSTTGQLLSPAPGDDFLFGIFGYTLADNAVFVRNGVVVSGLGASPPIFDPTGHDAAGARLVNRIQFSLSQSASVTVDVVDTRTATVMRRMSFPGLPAGVNVVTWDGKANDGRYVAPGTYRLSVSATQRSGFRSLVLYTLQRVRY